MSPLKILRLFRSAEAVAEPAPLEAERLSEPPAEEGRAVFQEAVLVLEDYHRVRVVITHIGASRLRIAYAERCDLPFRVRLSAPTLKLRCWTRVVAQNDGTAELELQPDAEF